MNFSIHPFVLIAGIAAIVSVVMAIFAFRASRTASRVVLAVVAAVFALPALYLFALLHPELIDARFRTYKAFYSDIREGMSREEVFAVLERRYPAGGPRQRPKVMSDAPDNLGFFMNPETSREPNCEGIFLRISDGRVNTKSYSPD